MDANTMPGDAEAAAAIAAMNEIYISGWTPEPGDMVRVRVTGSDEYDLWAEKI